MAVRRRSPGNKNNATECQMIGLGIRRDRMVARTPSSREKAVETTQAGIIDGNRSSNLALNERRNSSHKLACPKRTIQHTSHVKPKQMSLGRIAELGMRLPWYDRRIAATLGPKAPRTSRSPTCSYRRDPKSTGIHTLQVRTKDKTK